MARHSVLERKEREGHIKEVIEYQWHVAKHKIMAAAKLGHHLEQQVHGIEERERAMALEVFLPFTLNLVHIFSLIVIHNFILIFTRIGGGA